VPTRLAPLALAVVAVAVSFSACARDGDRDQVEPAPEAFCEAAIDLDRGLERMVGLDRQVRLVRRVAETAPADVEADAQTFLEAMEAVRADPDDPSLRDDPDVQEAVENVNRYAVEGCALYEQEGGGSPF
jgi:hypothetical protein